MPRAIKRASGDTDKPARPKLRRAGTTEEESQPAKLSLKRSGTKQSAQAVVIYDPMEDYPLPRKGGPPSIPNGAGRTVVTATEPYYEVMLSSGAFRVAWETLEARAKENWRKYKDVFPEYAEAMVAAVEMFRSAATEHAVEEKPKASRKWQNRSLPKKKKAGGVARKGALAKRSIKRPTKKATKKTIRRK